MRGVAKWFNTEEDVRNCMAVDKVETKERLREMLESRFSWFPEGKLEESDQGVEDDTHKIVTMPAEGSAPPADGEEQAMERWQYELREDPNAWLFRIGLTVEKINAMLEE